MLFRSPCRVTIGKRLEQDGVVTLKRRGVEGEADVPAAEAAQAVLDAL